MYLDPYPLPNGVNQIWPDLADHGAVWGVTRDLAPGEIITLTLGDAYYRPEYSELPETMSIGTWIYAQVDSANAETDYGGILEVDELIDIPYNNINAVQITASQITIGGEDLGISGDPQTSDPSDAAREPVPPRPQ